MPIASQPVALPNGIIVVSAQSAYISGAGRKVATASKDITVGAGVLSGFGRRASLGSAPLQSQQSSLFGAGQRSTVSAFSVTAGVLLVSGYGRKVGFALGDLSARAGRAKLVRLPVPDDFANAYWISMPEVRVGWQDAITANSVWLEEKAGPLVWQGASIKRYC